MLVMIVYAAKTTEPIELPFEGSGQARVRGAHGNHLANTTERSMHGSDAGCCYHYSTIFCRLLKFDFHSFSRASRTLQGAT